jgi:formamidopyrimidine-DNA glycosylase
VPELPEVETVCRGLRASILGDTVSGVEVLRNDSVEYPDVKTFSKSLVGHEFSSVSRRGKYILLTLDGQAGLAVHLRMSGRFIVMPGDREAERFLRVRLQLKSGRQIQYSDMRVFGRLWYVPKGESFETVIPTLAELGPEPLEQLTAEILQAALKNRKQVIKTALLDQRIVAGIGNIYADESLFLSGINPLRPAGSLKKIELIKLTETIQAVLTRAIEAGGTTFSDYTNAEGVNGRYQHEAHVYGRDGEKCRVCASVIERVKVGGRSTHFCVVCQKNKRSRGIS